MKRRLPTIRKGAVVLAAISVPPLTAHANRHAPSPAHPGSPAAAANAEPIPASAIAKLGKTALDQQDEITRLRQELSDEITSRAIKSLSPWPTTRVVTGSPGQWLALCCSPCRAGQPRTRSSRAR
jgi:hypothetical protein